MTTEVDMTIFNMDVMTYLERCERAKVMFADPPDNIGLDYGDRPDGGDRRPARDYYNWMEAWILRAMLKCDILWISYYHKHDMAMGRMLGYILENRHPAWAWQKVIWRFTFGQYTDRGIPNGHRPMVVLSSPAATFHYDAIRVPSERMLTGDSRAAGPRIPDDVWDIPRVTGNSAERRAWHPTQHPEELMSRIMSLCGHPFVDLFGGTGTSLRVGKRLGKSVSVVERSPLYCAHMSADSGIEIVREV